MTTSISDLEKTNLEVHVDKCEQRYLQVERRLDNMEQKMDELHQDMKQGNSQLLKVIIGAAASIVTGLLSVTIVILIG